MSLTSHVHKQSMMLLPLLPFPTHHIDAIQQWQWWHHVSSPFSVCASPGKLQPSLLPQLTIKLDALLLATKWWTTDILVHHHWTDNWQNGGRHGDSMIMSQDNNGTACYLHGTHAAYPHPPPLSDIEPRCHIAVSNMATIQQMIDFHPSSLHSRTLSSQ